LTHTRPARMSRPARRPDGRCLMGSPNRQRKVRAPREHGAGQPPAGATPGTVPQKTNRPRSTVRQQWRAPRSAGKGETVRQKRTAPLATGAAGQTPPGARPNRGGRRHGTKIHFALWPRRRSRLVARVGRVRRAARRVPEEWSSRAVRRTFSEANRMVRTEPGLQAVWRYRSTGRSIVIHTLAHKVTHKNKPKTKILTRKDRNNQALVELPGRTSWPNFLAHRQVVDLRVKFPPRRQENRRFLLTAHKRTCYPTSSHEGRGVRGACISSSAATRTS
jgi:hypothetical protein